MPCAPLPAPPAPPALPDGISLTPTLPSPDFDPELCCKLLPFDVPSAPIPLPPAVWNSGVAAAVDAILASVQAFLDAASFNCPKE